MITAEVTGTLPAFSQLELRESLGECGKLMLAHIKNTFNQGGDPKWAPLAKGGPSFLWESGTLFSKNNYAVGPNYVEAGQFGGPIYQWIHQYGGVVANPFGLGFPRIVTIPARPYAVWSQELINKCVEELERGAVKFLNTKGEPVHAA